MAARVASATGDQGRLAQQVQALLQLLRDEDFRRALKRDLEKWWLTRRRSPGPVELEDRNARISELRRQARSTVSAAACARHAG
jgi:hypothetical protein